MTDPIYEPPKADSEWQEKKPSENGWSLLKLLCLTFLPFSLCVMLSFVVLANDGTLKGLDVLIVIILFTAGGIAITQAAYFTKQIGGEALHFVGYLLLWGVAHFALILLGVYACGIIANPRFL